MTKTGTQRLLEKALTVTRPGTKYGLAKRLGMNPSNLNRALAGSAKLGPRPAVLLAEVLDLEPLDVLAVTQADAARTVAEKEFWHRKVPRFLLALSLGLMLRPFGLPESTGHGLTRPPQEPIYIMRTRRKRAA
jgi:transcriptional regulator with XRE-family HTH domain